MSERCPRCDYDLRGAEVDRCPECGAALVRTLVLRDDRAMGWRLAVAGTSVALVTNLLMLASSVSGIIDATPTLRQIQLVNAGMLPAADGPNWRWLAITTVLATVAAAGTAVVLSFRDGWLGYSRRRRRAVGCLVILAPALNVGLLYLGHLVAMF